MKVIKVLSVEVVFILLAKSVLFAQGAGILWDTLNKEVGELYLKGQYDRAEVVAKKALEVAEKKVGTDHPSVATSLHNLADIYRIQGQYAQAEPLYKRVLVIYEKSLGPDHPDVANCLTNLAQLYRATRRGKKAAEFEQRAAAIRTAER
ncbi:MAG: tetratricopeptide repeat-containing protein [Candidatus Brocadiaceae baterium WH-1]|nr:MAG: tetratricopeptide repeat-containing protein [Candidatus Jettenia sp. AMX2]